MRRLDFTICKVTIPMYAGSHILKYLLYSNNISTTTSLIFSQIQSHERLSLDEIPVPSGGEILHQYESVRLNSENS